MNNPLPGTQKTCTPVLCQGTTRSVIKFFGFCYRQATCDDYFYTPYTIYTPNIPIFLYHLQSVHGHTHYTIAPHLQQQLTERSCPATSFFMGYKSRHRQPIVFLHLFRGCPGRYCQPVAFAHLVMAYPDRHPRPMVLVHLVMACPCRHCQPDSILSCCSLVYS